jgi:glycosyltransferase involved in cell wall biosynthesis
MTVATSVIITSYDVLQLPNIAEVLRCLKTQTYQDFELVYVTEGDKLLRQTVERYITEDGINGRVIYQSRALGLGEARNLGAFSSIGKYLVFLDDDVVLPEGYLQRMTDVLSSDEGIVGVTGHAIPLPINGAIIWLPSFLHWAISCTTWMRTGFLSPVRNAWGHGMAFKRDSFIETGGFPARTGFELKTRRMENIGEDLMLSLRIRNLSNGVIAFDPTLQLLHKIDPEKLRLRTLVKRTLWVGRTRRILRDLVPKEAFSNEIRVFHLPHLRNKHPLPVTNARLTPLSLIGSAIILFSLLIGFLSGTSWSQLSKPTYLLLLLWSSTKFYFRSVMSAGHGV